VDIHLVGGFLGSGKTTAIATAARHLTQSGKRVGIVTNDQGNYLVDTAFFSLADVPTLEVTGGCFCCNYNDLDQRLNQLSDGQPDVIFAESVGSCADLVATVIRPLARLRHTLANLSVFVDIRFLDRRLRGEALPFSDDVVYIFDKQIEEAGLLILNKADLVSSAEAEAVERLARDRYPDKQIRLQNSLDEDSVTGWLQLLTATPPVRTVQIDYQRYGTGEAQLAWLNEEVVFTTPPDSGHALVMDYIQNLLGHLGRTPIGHLKFLVRDESHGVKISFTGLPSGSSLEQVGQFSGGTIGILVNARAEVGADRLRSWVQQAAYEAAQKHRAQYREQTVEFFHPSFPKPTHRMLDT
jgi:Ni2+-binding GTPase involved in maturation of urease and hydrogenase